MLNGQDMEINYTTTYFERQPYLNNPTQIMLSNELAIVDLDVGPKNLIEARVTLLGGKEV